MQRTMFALFFVFLWAFGPAAAGQIVLPVETKSAGGAGGLYGAQLEAIHARLADDGDFDAAHQRFTEVFDQVVAFVPARDRQTFTDAALAVRLTGQLQAAKLDEPLAMYQFLRDNEELCRALVFAALPEDDPKKVYALLERFIAERGKHLNEYATLTAAICLVHDKPLERRINENAAKAPDPLALFDYFVKYEKHMIYGIRGVPTEILVWVVDSTASIEEMEWALGKYRGDRQVGRRFFDVRYDYDHYRTGAPKRITRHGFNLPNIKQYGGVCADQAYFAMSVGKAIGVPTAYTIGLGREVGHAWVGYFEAGRGGGRWNFDVGRYQDYKYIKGNTQDPQTRRPIADGEVSVLAELVGTKPDGRYAAAALTDAVKRLLVIERQKLDYPPKPPSEQVKTTARENDLKTQLSLLEEALKDSPGYKVGWFTIAELAEDGKLSLAEKRTWATILQRMCGTKYPDFTLAVLKPMIQTVDDVKAQEAMWNNAFKLFARRRDLAAEVCMAQAEMWDEAGDFRKAGRYYEQIIRQFANDGPFVLKALSRTEELLIENKMSDKVLTLYANTWSQINRPKANAAGVFLSQSTWYRVGYDYLQLLKRAGAEDQAAKVEQALKSVLRG